MPKFQITPRKCSQGNTVNLESEDCKTINLNGIRIGELQSSAGATSLAIPPHLPPTGAAAPQALPGANKKKESGRASRFKNFCFTSFEAEHPIFDPIDMRYLAFGEEICPSTKKKHWQSFCCMKEQYTISQFKKYIFKTYGVPFHFESCKGSLKENEAYCSKEGKFTTFGTEPCQGKRSDLEQLRDAIVNDGLTADEICLESPMLSHQYGRTISKLETIVLRQKWRTEMTTCDWLMGPTGTGKSHRAMEGYNPSTHYIYRNDNGWWDGYKGQHTVVINEFRGEIKFNELLQLIDKWPHFVKQRNCEAIPFISKHIIITSPLHPRDVYGNGNSIDEHKDNIEQLLRRVVIEELTVKY